MRGNRLQMAAWAGVVAVSALFGAGACNTDGDGNADAVDGTVPHRPLDPTSDWRPSSDWAAKGDRESPDGGGGEDLDGRYDASSDGGRDGGWGADADADARTESSPPDGLPGEDADPDVPDDVPTACDPDAEDGGGCDDVTDDVPGDAGPPSDVTPPCDPDAEDGCDGAAKAGDGGADDPDGSEDVPGDTGPVDYDTPYVMYLSADDSNSQASPILARWYIQGGRVVPWDAVRVYEFLNYYDIRYEAPPAQQLRAQADFRAVDPAEGLYALQIGVQSYPTPLADRRPMNLTFVLDTSGSMDGRPIELEREVVRAIASSLRAGDVVSAVEWDDTRSVRLDSHAVGGPDDPAILAMAAALAPGGSTDLHGGLVTGYDLARANYREGWLNRVVLVSDGQANTGITDIEIIASAADEMEGEGIYLVGVGCGDGYYDTLMDDVTDAGRGAYLFIDRPEEAHKMFGERFLSSLEVAARDVQVELTLPGIFRIEEFHGEEYSANPAEVDPQHLAPDDAMVFHQIVRAADPERVWAEDRVTVRVTYDDPTGTRTRTTQFSDTLQNLVYKPAPVMRKADAVVVYAQALMRISTQLEASDSASALDTCRSAREIVAESATALDDAELEEIAGLLDTYCLGIEHGSFEFGY